MTDIREEVYYRSLAVKNQYRSLAVKNSGIIDRICAQAFFQDSVHVHQRVELRVADQVKFSPSELQ